MLVHVHSCVHGNPWTLDLTEIVFCFLIVQYYITQLYRLNQIKYHLYIIYSVSLRITCGFDIYELIIYVDRETMGV